MRGGRPKIEPIGVSMQKKIARVFIILLLVAMVAALTACTIDSDSKNPFDKEPDKSWVWQLDKKATIEKTTDAITNQIGRAHV